MKIMIFSKDIKDIINETVDEVLNKIKMESYDFKFDCGDQVKDVVTEFVGVVICRSQWLTGCNTYGVKPIELKDGRPQDLVSIDENQLKLLEKHYIKINIERKGRA